MFQVGFWEELKKLGIISKQARQWEETVTKLNNIKEITPQVPAKTFLGNLRSYQQDGLSWLYFLRNYSLGGILVDDMGLGKTVQTMFLEMMPEHKKIYDLHLARERQRVLGLMAEGGLTKNRFDILKSLTIMRQLCLHPQLVDAKHKNVPSAKIEALTEHIGLLVAQNHKVLIFSQFTSFLALAKEVLDKAKLAYLYLDGGTKDRGKLVKDFQNGGAQVFLISLKAGGFGLNLTEADFCMNNVSLLSVFATSRYIPFLKFALGLADLCT